MKFWFAFPWWRCLASHAFRQSFERLGAQQTCLRCGRRYESCYDGVAPFLRRVG